MIGDASFGAGALVVIGILYFAPAIVAVGNKRSRSTTSSILALNVLAGWTFIGWVAAFVWALRSEYPAVVVRTVDPDVPDGRDCPHCLSRIPRAASVCRYCQRDVAAVATLPVAKPTTAPVE